MGIVKKSYLVLNKRITNDKTQKSFVMGDTITAADFDQDTIADWLKSDVIKEAE